MTEVWRNGALTIAEHVERLTKSGDSRPLALADYPHSTTDKGVESLSEDRLRMSIGLRRCIVSPCGENGITEYVLVSNVGQKYIESLAEAGVQVPQATVEVGFTGRERSASATFIFGKIWERPVVRLEVGQLSEELLEIFINRMEDWGLNLRDFVDGDSVQIAEALLDRDAIRRIRASLSVLA